MDVLSGIKRIGSQINNLEFRWRVVSIVSAFTVLLVVFTASYYAKSVSVAKRVNIERGEVILKRLADLGRMVLLNGYNIGSLDDILNEAGVRSAIIVDKNGEARFPPAMHSVMIKEDVINGYEFKTPIFKGSQDLQLGTALLSFSSNGLIEEMGTPFNFLCRLIFFSIIGGAVVSFFIIRWANSKFHHNCDLDRLLNGLSYNNGPKVDQGLVGNDASQTIWLDMAEVIGNGMFLFDQSHKLVSTNHDGEKWLRRASNSWRGAHVIEIIKMLPMRDILNRLMQESERDKKSLVLGHWEVSSGIILAVAVLRLKLETGNYCYGIIVPPYKACFGEV